MFDASKFLKRVNLRNRQRKATEMYKKEGLTESVIGLQLQINKERHENDIEDENERIYKEFVQ